MPIIIVVVGMNNGAYVGLARGVMSMLLGLNLFILNGLPTTWVTFWVMLGVFGAFRTILFDFNPVVDVVDLVPAPYLETGTGLARKNGGLRLHRVRHPM